MRVGQCLYLYLCNSKENKTNALSKVLDCLDSWDGHVGPRFGHLELLVRDWVNYEAGKICDRYNWLYDCLKVGGIRPYGP